MFCGENFTSWNSCGTLVVCLTFCRPTDMHRIFSSLEYVDSWLPSRKGSFLGMISRCVTVLHTSVQRFFFPSINSMGMSNNVQKRDTIYELLWCPHQQGNKKIPGYSW